MKLPSMKTHVFLSVFFVMTFRIFQFFPGMALVQELWFVLCFIFLLTVYPFWKSRKRWSLSSFELYLLAITLLIPLLAGISAWREFGQPIVYGLLSQRNVTLFAGALLLIHGLRYQIFTLRDVEKSLLFLAWATLILYLAMKTLLDPAMFVGYGKGFVDGEGSESGASFKLSGIFIIFGIFYYAFLGFRKKVEKYYLMAGLFFIFLLGDAGGRSLTVAMLTAFIFFAYRWSRRARLINFLPKILVVSMMLLGAAYFANPKAVSSRVEKFSDAFAVVFTGKEVQDVSANARIFETLIATPYVQKNPLLGSGNISTQWKGGYEGVLGGYFHPSDIGVVGVLYMYGVVGLLLFAWQYWFAIKTAIRLPTQIHSPLLDATKGILLYLAINSLATGFFVHYAEISFLFIALLGCIVKEMRTSDHPVKIG